MSDSSVQRLRMNVLAASNEVLIALANKGLMRRAIKDAEKLTQSTPPKFQISLSADHAIIQTAQWTVTIPAEGPSAASDDTPATGMTRQILTATLLLRGQFEAESSTDAQDRSQAITGQSEKAAKNPPGDRAREMLCDAEWSRLARWNGKTPLLEAMAFIQTKPEWNITDLPHLTIHFAAADVRVILLTDQPAASLRQLLDQFRTTAKPEKHAMWVMASVIALKQTAGIGLDWQRAATVNISAAVLADQQRVIEKVKRLLAAIAGAGIAHPSTRTLQRLQSSAVSAEACRLPRLSRLLEGLAHDVSLQISRHAAADCDRITDRLVLASALCSALSTKGNQNRIDLCGQPRSQYVAAPKLEMSGLGANGWKTASGFHGVTCYFYDIAGQRFLTATLSRGIEQDPQFSVAGAYRSGVGWTGGATIEKMCRSIVDLDNVSINQTGRLSTSEKCQANVRGESSPSQWDAGKLVLNRWEDLLQRAQAAVPLGLKQSDPRDSLVILRPTKWGQRSFDELNQMMLWPLLDASGKTVTLRTPWTELNEPAIGFMESLQIEPERVWGVFGRVQVSERDVWVQPISFLSEGGRRGDRVLCPQFDGARITSRNQTLLDRLREKRGRRKKVVTQLGTDSDFSEADSTWGGEATLSQLPAALRQLIVELDRLLRSTVESGADRLHPAAVTRLSELRQSATVMGLETLGEAMDPLLQDDVTTSSVLVALYRLRLAQQGYRQHALQLG